MIKVTRSPPPPGAGPIQSPWAQVLQRLKSFGLEPSTTLDELKSQLSRMGDDQLASYLKWADSPKCDPAFKVHIAPHLRSEARAREERARDVLTAPVARAERPRPTGVAATLTSPSPQPPAASAYGAAAASLRSVAPLPRPSVSREVLASSAVRRGPPLPTVDHARLIGREAECVGVNLQRLPGTDPKSDVARAFGGAFQAQADKGRLIRTFNGHVLAASPAIRLGVPALRLEVEGMNRGSPCIELVTGPMTPGEYEALRGPLHALRDVLQKADRSKPLSAAIETYNKQVDAQFRLDPDALASQLSIAGAVTLAGSLQYNLGAPVQTLNRQLAGLSQEDITKDPFVADLMAAGPNLELACRCLQHYRETSRSHSGWQNWDDGSKHHFGVLPKFSPEDLVLTAMSPSEVARLQSVLSDPTQAQRFKEKFEMSDRQLDGLAYACTVRASHDEPLILGKTERFHTPVQVYRADGTPVPGVKVIPNSPRPQGRIPLTRGPAGMMGVLEFRRAYDSRNTLVDGDVFKSVCRV